MRTIDADALYKDICRAYDECGDILEIIDKQPTIEPRKGKWETDSYPMDDGEYLMTRCTACGTAYEYGHNENYCGFCGADMRGGEDENNSRNKTC